MQFWKNFGIATKIWSCFSIIILLLVAIGGAGYVASTDIQHTVDDLFEFKIPAIDYLIEADRDLQQALVAERTMFFVDPGSDVFKDMQADYIANVGQVIKRTGNFFALNQDEETLKYKEQFDKAMATWRPMSEGIIEAISQGNEDQALRDKEVGEALAAFESMRDILDKLTEMELEEAKLAHEASKIEYDMLTIVLVGGTLISFALACLFAYVLTRSIIGPVNRGVALAENIKQGDLSERMRLDQQDELGRLAGALDAMSDVLEERVKLADSIADGNLDQDVSLVSDRDALGKALATMVKNMNEALHEVKSASDQIAAGAGQVNEASTALSQGSTEQAASIEEINSSMTEIGSQTRNNAESATEANKMMSMAVEVVGGGRQAGQDMAASMTEISDASSQVAKIIKVIDEIAFQTNLLALNAAVEAARAGRHGKGFAVVAEEVRNLAGRSAKAAQETTELIQRAVDKVDAGMGLTKRVDSSFEEIVESASGVADLVAEIATSSNEQAQGVGQVNAGMNQVDQVTQQNTANAEETASAATVLSGQAVQLQEILTRFRLQETAGGFTASSATVSALPQAEDDTWGMSDELEKY